MPCVSALITLTIIIELSRRRHLHEKYAIMWLVVAVVIAFFAIFPGLFNSLAHWFGVKNPPDLFTVTAALFLFDRVRAPQLGGGSSRGPLAGPGRRGGPAPQGPRRRTLEST